jgi:hypothetical protein
VVIADIARMRRTPSVIALRPPFFRFRCVLFRQDVLRRIGEGEVMLAFRRWRRPAVRAGGTLRTSAGVLAIESVDVVDERDVTERTLAGQALPTARRCSGRDRGTGRCTGSSSGWPDRIPASRSAGGGRSRTTSARRSTRASPDLAATMGRETAPFKADVRKLKELGLTESLPVGYRLSPRGRAYYGYRGVARKRSRSR